MSAKTAAQAIIDDVPALDIPKEDLQQLGNVVRQSLKQHHEKLQKDTKIADWQRQIDRLQDKIDNA